MPARVEPTEEEILKILDDIDRGRTRVDIAHSLGMCPATLSKVIASIQTKHGVLTKYRDIQSLRLTELQAMVLESISEEDIAEASLTEKVNAFKILNDKERLLEGKASDIKGLVGYLIQLEKEDAQGGAPIAIASIMEDAEE